ncbi:transglycosylase domain-containing protein [Kitasatospora sp. NBC_01250]|uniref:transglycosylase domain-containing protein n=1 Tax=unclassified Kitasatospora TaxID=2633591 RepID=UPI002E162090|nr:MULTISPECIES: transglycosylase domain-containing protein [unclassified Kitasatospora]WSJ66403.1 transglycosylase domain-containing protein [Kitasatospora sp. NBC_01302]
MSSSHSGSFVHKTKLTATFLGVSVVAGALTAGLALPAVGGLGLGAKSAVGDFNSLPDDFTTPPLSQASTIYDANGGVIATVFDRDRTVVPSDQISPLMKSALVDIEDNRFYQHGAIDVKGVLRALSSNASGGGTQGASTLTQQYVKNVFVEEAGNDSAAVQAAQAQDVGRKVKEMKYAIKVEQTLTKDQILTNYLNITFFGEQAYGIQAASQRYFGVDAKDLSLPQAALLAGLVQSPSGYDPIVNPKAAKERRDTVLKKMAQYGTITQAQADQAIATPVTLNVNKPNQGCITAQQGEGFFCDYVKNQVLNDPAFGASSADRAALWKRGGLQIHTTLDPTAQTALQKSVTGHVYATDKAATAMTIVQPGTGKIIAMGQSRPYGVNANQTQINYNVTKSMGGGIGFPTGSTFKPIVAAAALENGINPSQSYPSPYSMAWPKMKDCQGQGFRPAQVHNDATSLVGPFTMAPAMAQSVNTYFASLEADAGLCNVAQMTNKLGITQQAGNEPLQVVPAMALGSNDLTPLEMANVYATFAAHGTYCTPTAIASVTGPDGKPLNVPQSQCSQAMSATTADEITTMLKGVVQDGTGSPAGLTDRDSAGKTGTTNDSEQVWFVGYTPELAGATVVTDTDNPTSLDGQRIGGKYVDQAFGGTLSGPIWRDAMSGALQNTPPSSLASVPLP